MRTPAALRPSLLLTVLALAATAATPGSAVLTQTDTVTATVEVFNFGYRDVDSDQPVTIINGGESVEFVWLSGFHSVTHGTKTPADLAGSPVAGDFDSDVLGDPEEPFVVTFPESGVFSYYCQIHDQMRGIVIAL